MKKGDKINLPLLASELGVSDVCFIVTDVLGGGMGTCLKVSHPESNLMYAVKIIHAEKIADNSSWLRFIQELKVWFELSQSEGVVEALCMERINEVPCMCSPWMVGETLRDQIVSGKLTKEHVLKNIIRVVNTLKWAYETNKVVHRDLKPENILFDSSGLAYVSDWGLAKLADSCVRSYSENGDEASIESMRITRPGLIVGTVLYSSPEQIRGDQDIDYRSDMYSLGCMLFEFEQGHPPFSGNNRREILNKHLHAQPEHLGHFWKQTSFGLGKIVDRCLQKHPNDRYQSYEDLIGDLAKVCRKYKIACDECNPGFRKKRPPVGVSEFTRAILNNSFCNNANFGVVEFDDLKPYFDEFQALAALDQWEKAREIIEPLYVQELTKGKQSWHFGHDIAVNFGLCLARSGQAGEAVKVFAHMSCVSNPTNGYYVNYALALLYVRDYSKSEQICVNGLKVYPHDKDLIGNYVVSLVLQNKHSATLEILKTLCAQGKDIKYFEIAAAVLNQMADELNEIDWMRIVEFRINALKLLLQAKKQNPRFLTARYSLACTFLKLEQYELAIKEFNDVLALQEHRDEITECAMSCTALIMLETGSLNECIEYCRRWMPKFNEPTKMQRVLYMAVTERYVQKDGVNIIVPQALEFFEGVLNGKDSQVEDFCYLAELYARKNEYDKAIVLLDRASVKYPNHWLLPYYKALVDIQGGKNEESLTVLSEAAKLAPCKSDPEWKMSQIYKSLGNNEMSQKMHLLSEEKKKKRLHIVNDALRGLKM